MDHGYIRLSRRGPSEAEQRAKLRAEGIAQQRIHVDDQTTRKRNGNPPSLRARVEAIQCVRPGDALVVATPGRLGVGLIDIRETIKGVAGRGGRIKVAGGVEFGGPEMEALIAFEAAASLEVERERLEPARGRSPKTKKELRGAKREKVEAMWRDPANHTVAACEMEGGVSRRWLYNRFGPRTGKAAS